MFLLPPRIRSHSWRAARPPPAPEPRKRDYSEKTCIQVPKGYAYTPKYSSYTEMKFLGPFLRFTHRVWPKTPNAPEIFNGYIISGFAIIEVVPVEIVLEVASHLALEDIAALALTSKKMLSTVGHQIFVELNRCAVSRFNLLLYLEKEIHDMKEILCHRCQVFHPPTSSILAEGNDGIRPCVERSQSQRDWSTSSPYLPPNLHFNMIKAVMRSYRNRLDLYNPRVLSSSLLYVDENTTAKARYTATSVIADNQLLLRTVVTLLPSPIRGEARSAAPNLLHLVNKSKRLSNVCPHVEWSQVYPNIFEDTPPRPRDHYQLGKDYRDSWGSHTKPFPGRGFFDSCEYCSTLFHYNYRDLEVSGARVTSLVSYKFLGKGEDFNDRVWQLQSQEAAENEKRRMRIAEFQIYSADAWCRERRKLPEYSGRLSALDPFCFEGLDTLAT